MAKRLALLLVLLLAFALRIVALESVPPGWRDDEAIETTVHAQRVLDGDYPLYFVQAEGHEPLYHYLSAGWIALAGRSLFSVRLVSVFLGLLTVTAAYRLTRQLFGARLALLAALLLAVSFWGLMYSRVKIRHTAELPFALLAFSHLFRAIRVEQPAISLRHWLWVVLFITLALYTYLAAATLLLTLAAFGVYLLIARYVLRASRTSHGLAARSLLRLFLALVAALLLYLPLASAIRQNAARLAVVGGPLAALREGDLQPLLNNAAGTLAMFGNAGDPEFLYNIAGRPVFNLAGFYFFLAGVLLALWRWRDPRYAFLLIWLACGLAPGVASNPPASLGHTLTAMPVVYVLAALPATQLAQTIDGRRWMDAARTGSLLSVVLLAAVILSDLPDYFWRWPALPEVRYLYKAQLHAVARTLRGQPAATYVLDGPLSKWDRVAFTLERVPLVSPPRWVNAEWAIVFPPEPVRYLFATRDWQVDSPAAMANGAPVQFTNGLIFEGWDPRGREVIAHWRVGPAYAVVEPDMGASVASPPFPAFAFMHLLDANGAFVAGSDRFDADAFVLQPGDRYLQRHLVDAPGGTYQLEIGLYNPTTGERVPAADGRDSIALGPITLP